MSWATPADDNPFADPSVSAARTSTSAGPAGDDAPSWLSAGRGAGGAPVPPPPVPQGQQPQMQQAGPTQEELDRQAKVPQLMIYMRLANMGLCVLLAATAVVNVFGGDLSKAVLACYLFAFSCILCCFETHLKVVAKTIAANFGFLYNAKGRAVFLLFVGFLCFSFGSNLLGVLSGILMLINAVFNLYVICKYPEFGRDLQRKDLESEGRDYLRANRGQMAEAAGNLARNNPELAAKGATTLAWTYV